jgi:hypothetical protein
MKLSNKHYDDLIASENDENFGNINMKYTHGLSCCMINGLQNIGNNRVESSCRCNRNNNIIDQLQLPATAESSGKAEIQAKKDASFHLLTYARPLQELTQARDHREPKR